MKKRNFWMKCLAFMLVVVMILSEQNITTLGETIGDYTQERMAASSEKKSKNIASENHSKETPEETGSSDETSGETSANQNNSQENQKKQQNNSEQGNVTDNQGTGTSAGQTSLDKNTSSGDDANNQNQIESSANINENKTENKNDADKDKADKKDDADQEKKEDNAGDDQDAGNKQQEKQAEQQSAPAPNLSNNTGAQPTQSAPKKDKKQKKADAKAGDDTQGAENKEIETYLEAAERHYGENGTMETATVEMIPVDSTKTTVKTGEAVYYRVKYKLSAAATYNYGEKNEPLFDKYEETQIVLHLPAGMILDEELSTLRNITNVTQSTKDGKNDWILELNPSIDAKSDMTGSFVVALKTGDMESTMKNGTVPVNHVYDFGTAGTDTAPAVIHTEFTIMDKTGDTPVKSEKTYPRNVPTQSVLSDLTTETLDNWGISKEAIGSEVNDDNTVTVKYVLKIGLTAANGEVISDPGSYNTVGRTPFADGNTITLTETPSVLNRSDQEITANSITVTPRFGDKTPVSYTKGASVSIPVNTCSSYQGENGETLDAVDGNAPYYSEYDVAVVYPYDQFVANYYDTNQEKLTVNNKAEITWKLAGQTTPTTISDEDEIKVGDVTTPAQLTLTKSIFRYDAATGDAADVYNSTNYPAGDAVSGVVSFQIVDAEGKPVTLYKAVGNGYEKILNANNEEDGIVTYDPAQGESSVTVFMDPGTYTVKEVTLPSKTEKVTAEENEIQNAEDRSVTANTAAQTVTFYNKEVLGKITVDKDGQNSENEQNVSPLKGATFGLYVKKDADYEEIKTGVTNSSGSLTFERLPYGTYYVKEISAPSGYILDQEYHEVTIGKGNSSATVKSTNKYNLAPAKLQKMLYDVQDKEYEAVNRTNYTLFNNRFSIQKWDNASNQWKAMEETKYNNQSLGQDGTLRRNLPVYENDGTTLCKYRFVEKLPNGWYAAAVNQSQRITIEKLSDGTRLACTEGFTLENYLGNPTTKPYEVSMGNSRNGSISLTKKFYVAGTTGMETTTEEELSATFTLYYKDEENGTVTQYGTQTYTVNAGGTVNIIDLPLTGDNSVSREYYLVETAKPEGYESSDKDSAGLDGINAAKKTQIIINGQSTEAYGPFNFTEPIGEKDSEKIELEQTATINNVKQKVPVVVKKVDSYDNTFVPGTAYQIRPKNSNDVSTATTVAGNILNKEGASTALAPGFTYEVTETTCPAKYTYDAVTVKMPEEISATTTQEINLTDFGKVDVDTKAIEVTIKNKPDPKFKLTKKLNDATTTDKTLSEVTFEVYETKDGGKTFTRVNDYNNQPLTYTAGTELQVPAGTYYLKESNAAEKDVLDPSVYPNLYTGKGIYITKGDNTGFFFGPYEVRQQKELNAFEDIVNYSDKGAVTVTKYGMAATADDEGQEVPLAGAKLGIYKKGETDPFQTGISVKETGKVTFSDLPIYDAKGVLIEYEIKEIMAPEGYTKNEEDVLGVTLQPGKTVTTGVDEQELKLINQPVTSLEVEKTYYNVWEHAFTNRAYYLPGTVIALYKKSADSTKYIFESMAETNDMGLVKFENLTQKDEYVAVEVAVPEGKAFQYLEPQGTNKQGENKQYLGYEEDGNPPDEILAGEIDNYAYVKKEANPEKNNPQGAQTGKLVNVENWAQLHIQKYVLKNEVDTENNRRPIENAQFTLYMEVLDKDTEPNAELAFDQKNLSKYSVVGSYSSGTLYNADGTRKDGWFGTDILKAADNVVYWLVETNAGIGAEIRGENVVTLIKRDGTSYTNKTTYILPGSTEEETPVTYHPTNVMTYADNQVTKEYFRNDPVTGDGYEMFSTVRISKWAGQRNTDGDKVYNYSSLGNATFDLYLADASGQLYTKLDTITTGLDNDLSSGAASQTLSGWASSKAFAWTDMEKYVEDLDVSNTTKSEIVQTDSAGNKYVRVAIQESKAPTGYQMDKDIYYMYMFFQHNNETTTQIYNDAYYVKENSTGETEGNNNPPLAENQEGITWALYPTTEVNNGYQPYTGASIAGSTSRQYRLVNWPVDTQAVTVRTYGYEVHGDANLNMTSEKLNAFYATGAYNDRKNLDVNMRLERYEVDDSGKGSWKPYASGHTDGVFRTTDGYFAFPNGLKMGQYRIIETSVPEGYERIYNGAAITGSTSSLENAKAYYFQVSGDNVQISLYNPAKLSLSLKKTSVDKGVDGQNPATIDGVTFTLVDENAATTDPRATTVNGTATITNIGTGTYKLEESMGANTQAAGYTSEYFGKYFSEKYSEETYYNAEKNCSLNALVNGDGIFLGYDTALKSGEDGTRTSVAVTKKTDITEYGITPDDGIDLNIENPEKISFTIAKRDKDHTTTYLGGAQFEVEYLPFSAISGNISITTDDQGWTDKGTVTTASETKDGATKGKVTVTGNPGIYRITETEAPEDYDITDSTPKYVVMTGGLQIGKVTITGIDDLSIIRDINADIDFYDDKQVSLSITKTIDEGELSVSGSHKFTFSLYKENDTGAMETKPFKTLELTSINGQDATGEISGLSQGETYYLKETGEAKGFVFNEMKNSGNQPMEAEDGGYYQITMPDTGENISVTAVNTYLYAEAALKKVDGEDGTLLHDAEFIVKRVTNNADGTKTETEVTDVTFTEDGDTGIYRARIPLTGTAEETFRVYEKKAPTDYLKDDTLYVQFELEPGEKMANPVAWNAAEHAQSGNVDDNNQAMTDDYIFPNYCGAYINLTKYDDIHAVNPTATQSGAGFTLYSYDDTKQIWEQAASATTGEDGKIHFVVEGGKKYAIRETAVPGGYQGLDGIYTVSTEASLNDKPLSVDQTDSSLYLINNGQPIEAGITYEYKAYDIPKLSLEIQKHNALDETNALSATAALYEVSDQLTENSTDEAVENFLKGDGSGQTPQAKLSGINIKKEKTVTETEGEKEYKYTYTYADSTTWDDLGTALVAGKTYLVVETGTGGNISQIRDHSLVKWYDIFTVPANANKNYKQVATLKNVVGDASLELTKTAAEKKYTSLFTKEADVEYTITPTVEDNTYPLDDFTVEDNGLTAKNGTVLLDYNTYLKDKYSLYKVTVGKAEHDITSYAAGTVDDTIYATVTFYDSDGKVIHTTDPLNVSMGDQIAQLPANSDKKAAKISISYQANAFEEKTGYALGADFIPGSVKIEAVIDRQQGGENVQAIDSIDNSSTATLHYSKWKGDGTKETTSTEIKKTASDTIVFDEMKAAKITVNKAVENDDKVVNLGDIVTYNITVSNASEAKASMEDPYIVDYLPQGTTLVEYDDEHVVNLQAGSTNLKYDEKASSIGTQDGENAVIIAMDGELKNGESVTVQLKVRIEDTVTAYGKSISNYALAGSALSGVVTDKNKQGASFKNDTDNWAQGLDTILGNQISAERLETLKDILGSRATNGFVSASAAVNWATATDMALVKSAYGDGNDENGYTTDILSVVENGGTVHYKLSVSNIADANGAKEFSVIDILPNEGDITSADAARESQWSLNYKDIGPVYVSDENGQTTPVEEEHYKVYYYTGELSGSEAYGTLYDQVKGIKHDTTLLPQGWTAQLPNDKTEVKAFIVATDDTIKLEGTSSLVIEYTAEVNGGEEWDSATLNNHSWTNAVNSFSCICDQYDIQYPDSTWSTGVLGSNLVSATIMPEQVKVGGHIWIDKNNDGIWTTDESISNFGNNWLIQNMLDKVTVALSTYRGESSLPSTPVSYRPTGTWKNDAAFIFDNLNPAMLKENVSEAQAYPGNELDPGQLKGTEPYTYTLKVDLADSVGKYQFAKEKNDLRASYDPTAIPNTQRIDSNFVSDGTGSKTATSERFYLWATAPKIYDGTKDVGLVPYRDLVITKTTEDNQPISGVEFKVYGPYDSDSISRADLTDDKLVKPSAADNETASEISALSGDGETDSTTFTTDNEGKVTIPNLLWYKYYVIVEDSAPEGYELDVKSAQATEGVGTNVQELDKDAEKKPAWILGIPDDTKQTPTDTVSITNKRTPVETTLTASKEYFVEGKKAEKIPEDKFEIALWNTDPTVEGAQPICVKKVGEDGKVTFTGKEVNALSFTSTSNGTVFYITEQRPQQATKENGYRWQGITYDSTIYKATVKVEWVDGTGLVINKQDGVTYKKLNTDNQWVDLESSDVKFTNTYSVTPATFTPQVKKTFSADSVDRPTAKDFTFTLTADKSNPEGGAFTGVTNGASGTALTVDNTLTAIAHGEETVDFSTITFKKAGTYKFQIQEKPGIDLGYTYDKAEWTLTVKVDDVGGELKIIDTNKGVTYKSSDKETAERNDAAVFENTYSYVASININKEVLRGNAEYDTDDTFYAGIFRRTEDADGTPTGYEIVDEVRVDNMTVEGGVIKLINNGTVEVYVPLGGTEQTDAVTYYVFETDADGHPLVSFDADGNTVYNEPLAYEITSESRDENGVNSQGAVYVEANAHPTVTLTNRATDVTIEKTDMDGNPLSGATLELWEQAVSVDADVAADANRTKDEDGNVLLETWVSDDAPHVLTAELAVGGSYFLRETGVPAGYVQAADILFTVEDGEPITVTMVDEAQAGVLGQVEVTKRLSYIDETTFESVDLIAADTTVYVGLFTDPEGEHPYGDDYIRSIHIQEASSGTAMWDDLPSGTYYVFETLEDGTVIPYGSQQSTEAGGTGTYACVGDGVAGGAKVLSLDIDANILEGTTVLNNTYYDTLPDGYSYQGEIMLTKSIIKDGAPADSSDTFYAGVFTSETETVPYKVVELKNNDTVSVEVPLGGETGMDAITYYIYETDANGNKVDKNTFAYTVSGEGTVALDMDNTVGSRTIINTIPSDPEETVTISPDEPASRKKTTTKKTTTVKTDKDKGQDKKSSSSRTGDDNRVGLYILFFAAAVAGVVISLRRRGKHTEDQ